MPSKTSYSPVLSFFPRFIVALTLLQCLVLAIHSSPTTSSIIQRILTQTVALIHAALGTSFTVNGNVLTHQPSLSIENVIRIAHLFFEIRLPNNNFEFYHLYVWQIVNFITGLVVLLFLEKKFNNNRELHE